MVNKTPHHDQMGNPCRVGRAPLSCMRLACMVTISILVAFSSLAKAWYSHVGALIGWGCKKKKMQDPCMEAAQPGRKKRWFKSGRD